jgi:predicted Zn-ribbon and HTH transcriptional regulator
LCYNDYDNNYNIRQMVIANMENTEMEEKMAKGRIRLPTLTCKRCGHKWVPRTSDPGACPKCHSPHWNKALAKKGEKAKKS